MPDLFDEISVATYIAGFLLYGYIAYSAFAIGRVLSDGVYRRQALGLGVVTILIILLSVLSTIFPPGQTSTAPFIAAFSLYYAVFVGTYYWIDASIHAARLTDPLLRDTLHWSKLRVGFWAYDIVAYFVFLIAGLVFNDTYSNAPDIIVALIVFPAVIMVFSGAVVLPVASYRSRDRVLRTNLGWFGVYALIALNAEFGVLGFVFTGPTDVANLEELVVLVAGGYFLYRSVTALVPLYKFNERSATKPDPERKA